MGFCILSAFRGEETPAGQDMRPGGYTVKADAFFAPDSFLIISFALRQFEKRREKCKIEEEKREVRQWRLHVEVSGKKFFYLYDSHCEICRYRKSRWKICRHEEKCQ